jgi:GNAT superfamily N-acetyltransferase
MACHIAVQDVRPNATYAAVAWLEAGRREPSADMHEAPITIVRVPGAECPPNLLAQVDAIFLETSLRPPPPGPERDAFRERWLGRYLLGGTDVVLLALAGGNTVAGYLVGALEDPAPQERFADIGYFRTDFADLTRRFPAHLHINLTAPFRNRGIGAKLIEEFADAARAAGAPGMHVVTGRGMRNVRFYQRCGFAERARSAHDGGGAVFLGRELREPQALLVPLSQ